MARFSKNRLFSKIIGQFNNDLTVKTESLETEAQVTRSTVDTQVDSAVAALVSTAPATLDTLDELAAALNDDANFATTVTNSIATKANSADLATVATSGSYNDLSDTPDIGSSDTEGTVSKSGSIITLDYSTGNVFDVNVLGGADDNILRVTNPDQYSKLRVKLNAERVVEGNYQLLEPRTSNTTATIVASGSGSFNVGLIFKPDGTKMYIGQGRNIVQYNLATAWDHTTGTQVAANGYGSSYLSARGGIVFNTAGTKAYTNVGRTSNSGYAWASNLGTAWEVGTAGGASGSGSGTVNSYIYGMGRLGPGDKFIIARYDFKVQVRNSTPFGTLLYETTTSALGIGNTAIYDFAVNPEGTYVVAATGTTLRLFKLTTAYDFSTAVLEDSWTTEAYGCAWNSDGTELYVLTKPNTDGRAVTNWTLGTAITDPAISFYADGDETYNGNIPGLTHQGTSYIEISTVDTGSNYHSVISGNSSSGSNSGQVLAEYHAVCNGSALGNATTTNVTAVQNLTDAYADATGSVISGFTVPSGTNKIIYQYNTMISWSDTHAISHWKLYFSTDGSAWTEVVDARRNPASGANADTYQSFSWPFQINAASADTDSGKLTTTDGDTYYFKWQVREYGVNNEMRLHTTQYWDGSGTDQFSMPTVSIKCLS